MSLSQVCRYDRVVVDPKWQFLLQTHNLGCFQAIYGLQGGTPITCSSSTSVDRLLLLDSDQEYTLYIKKYWFLEPEKLWKSMLRGTFFRSSKVKREYNFLHKLHKSGLEAATPVAFGEQRFARWLTRSFLITEGVPEPISLDRFIAQVLPMLPDSERGQARRELIIQLANCLRQLHAQRFVHHDLYWRNIILSRHRLDRFILIDAPKGRRWLPWEERWCRSKDLATLDAPAPLFFRRTERLQFFLYYLGDTRLTPATKKLVRMILRRAEHERDRQVRRVLRERPSGMSEL